ncbi:MAG: selenide, water dikinase SelD [Planctomycetes bacterium]|nr:selenide, water dikinase SelD [Planctomycetota bacterium]
MSSRAEPFGPSLPTRDLVLVGGGHAHVQVLRGWAMRPAPGVRLTVVLDRPTAVYSGMVPAFVAGEYRLDELELDVVPLARRAGARVILTPATRVDPEAGRIDLAGRPSIPYDVASLDVGSSVRGAELPGVQEHALATRPIGRFAQRVDDWLRRRGAGAAPRVALVGAGAGGVELALALEARLRRGGAQPRVLLLDRGERLLVGAPARASRLAAQAARARGVEVRHGANVTGVEAGAVLLEGGERLDADLVVWVTGPAPPALVGDSPLPRDALGFVRVGPTLQVEGCPDLFAAGDCAALTHAPWAARAGVYAVRAGPPLAANLRARLAGAPLRRWAPQRDFLRLLDLSDGTALGWKWGVTVRGAWVGRWKRRIDRRFVARFQVLDAAGAPTPALPPMLGAEDMPCGGCAAKVGERALDRALRRLPPAPPAPDVTLGLEGRDDAAAFRLVSGEQVLLSVDLFRAFTDDPWLVGRVAAVNAVNDVLAKGVEARHALALVGVPEQEAERAEEALFQALSGARAALDPLGVALLGGHSTTGPELTVGFAVTGVLPSGGAPLTQRGLRPGERLVLTRPLGTGVLLRGDMLGRARGVWVEALLAALARDGAAAARAARAAGASACTDVTGFGLAGHLSAMLRASGVSAEVWLEALPALPGARELLGAGLRSTAHAENARARRALALRTEATDHPALELLFDPQTAGGLLFGLPPEREAQALGALEAAGERAAVIGVVTPARADGAAFSVAVAPGSAPPGG